MKIRTYTELSQLPTFRERYRYLQLSGTVCEETFGFDRYCNQRFYHSSEWRHVRDLVILRDNGCDLGIEGLEIYGRVLIHHMNPVSLRDLTFGSEYLLNLEYLICVSHETHNAIHYGDEKLLMDKAPVERIPNDTCPWRQGIKWL